MEYFFSPPLQPLSQKSHLTTTVFLHPFNQVAEKISPPQSFFLVDWGLKVVGISAKAGSKGDQVSGCAIFLG